MVGRRYAGRWRWRPCSGACVRPIPPRPRTAFRLTCRRTASPANRARFAVRNQHGPATRRRGSRRPAIGHAAGAGIKWGRQDFTWSRIEREQGKYGAGVSLMIGWSMPAAIAASFSSAIWPTGRSFTIRGHRKCRGLRRFCCRGGRAIPREDRPLADLERAQRRLLAGRARTVRSRILAAAGQAIHRANPRARSWD